MAYLHAQKDGDLLVFLLSAQARHHEPNFFKRDFRRQRFLERLEPLQTDTRASRFYACLVSNCPVALWQDELDGRKVVAAPATFQAPPASALAIFIT